MTRILLLSLCLFLPFAHAASLDDAREALNAGQYEQALQALNDHLSRQPQDADARFQKGLALVMLQRDEEAIRVFSDLVRDFPELPEPYNNLAVLYARSGQYEEARDALEAALVSHPSYATAHENLGDIYAALARAAYNRAIVLDKSNPALQGKLDVLARLDPNQGSGTPPAARPPQTVAAAEPVRATPAPTSRIVTQARSTPAPTPRVTPRPAAPVAQAPRQPASTPAPASAPAAAPAPVTGRPSVLLSGNEPVIGGAPAADSPAPSRSAPDEAAILAAVNRWAQSWSAQDVDAYLATYSPNFDPATGTSRAVWESQRRSRVVRPRSISVQVLNPSVFQGTASFARVDFLQIYESDTYSDQVRKQLELEKLNGRWLIVDERVVN